MPDDAEPTIRTHQHVPDSERVVMRMAWGTVATLIVPGEIGGVVAETNGRLGVGLAELVHHVRREGPVTA